MKLSPELGRDIKRWHQLVKIFNGRTVYTGVRRKRCQWQAYSDASFAGWGWAWAGRTEVGFWPQAYLPRFGQLSKQHAKLFSDDLKDAERIWIALCEAAAALFCLRRILPYIEPCLTLTFNEDNQNVVAWLAKLNCPSAMSKGIICEISWLLACFNIELDVRYINTLQNKLLTHVADDFLSRRWNGKSSLPTTNGINPRAGLTRGSCATPQPDRNCLQLWTSGSLKAPTASLIGSRWL